MGRAHYDLVLLIRYLMPQAKLVEALNLFLFDRSHLLTRSGHYPWLHLLSGSLT
jgi:hypothetical protein